MGLSAAIGVVAYASHVAFDFSTFKPTQIGKDLIFTNLSKGFSLLAQGFNESNNQELVLPNNSGLGVTSLAYK